ncbi:Fanconi anemia group B protein [Gadus morhua]|uniref:Fanconi anemia group B protein n=1 Tax=Gadus morhua TaxID=8049 RepID=UPI0011B72987|nr:Fanconi anemia group B protein [Gadus morhua]
MMDIETRNARGRACYLLSFCGRFGSLQCRRGGESNASEISFRSLKFNTEQNSFLAADDVRVLYKKRAADLNIVTCACVYDLQTRVSSPFILLKKGNKEGSYTYILLSLNSAMKQDTKMTFKLPYQLSEKVHIMHGPVVWWTRAGVGFSACVQEGRDVGVVRPTHACLSRPLIGLLPLHKGDVFVLGPMADQFQKGFSTTEISGHQTPSQGHGCLLGRAELFDPSVMLPRAYLPITRSLLVLRADAEGGVPTGSSVVAATSEKQLVRFEDGVPRDVCPLPFDAPEDLRVADTGRNGRLFAVSFDQGHVAAVWEDAFQVAARWSLVRSVHVEDFLGCGTEQLLLVFEEEEEEDGTGRPFERFLLTDLCGISLSSGQKNREGSASLPAGHNHLLTFQALESRLQSGLSVVQALRSDERLKQRVLLQALQALSDMVSGRETILTPPEQEGLFSLWDEEAEAEEVCDEEMQVDSPEGQVMSSGPRLERLWHRFVDDHLVVGAMVTVDGSSPVDCVSLSLLTNAGHGSAPTALQTRSQVFPLPSPSSSSPPSSSPPPGPAAKRGKADPDDGPDRSAPGSPRRLAVTAATRLTSLLTRGRVKCPVTLRYVRGEATPAGRPALRRETAPGERPVQAALQCGQVTLDIRTDFHGGALTDPALATEEGLLSALSVLDRWLFLLDSPHHSLGDMEDWMQKAACCTRSKVNPRYLVTHPRGAAAAMLLRWSPASPFRGELSVHGSRLQALQFLERLCGFLLASCSVRLLGDPEPQAGPRALALALEAEALLLRGGASSLLSGEEEERPGPPDDPPEEEERGRRRREWEEELGRSRRRLSPLVDAARYCGLTRGLCEVQRRADVAALLLGRTGSCDPALRR